MFGVERVHAQVDDAGLVVDVEDFVPGLAAVLGLEQAAFLVRAVESAEGADIDNVGALADYYSPTERGLFKSKDGGKT